MTNADVMVKVSDGYRMPPPADCPDAVVRVMAQCWREDFHQRPRFPDIIRMLKEHQRTL